jgi:hypothetical protein
MPKELTKRLPTCIWVELLFHAKGKHLPMHLLGAFELELRSGTPDNPAGVKIALLLQRGDLDDLCRPWI